MTLSTVALQSDIETRWIAANGPLVNLAFAAALWVLLRRSERFSPATLYFLVLAMAGNLFTATGYLLYSGFTNFGDLTVVVRGLQPHWMWRLGLIVLGGASYYASMLLVAAELTQFRDETPRRIRVLSWTPYFTDGILAGVAGLFNPAGFFYVIASALPSTFGANAGLLSLPNMMRKPSNSGERLGPIRRSVLWITSGIIASLIFIFVLGRGISWSR